MPPSREKSELERRFEKLFSQIFRCDWQEHLQDEYHVQVDGQNLYIDYVYIGQGRRIAIELDGHGKIKGAADSSQKFHDFLARQNALMSQGFEVYRFGWHHVVSFGGWQARRDLKRIFRGLIQPTPEQKVQKPAHSTLRGLPVLWKPRNPGSVITSTASQSHQSHQNKPSQGVEVIEVQPYQPAPQQSGVLRGFVVGVLALGITVLLFDKIRPAQQPQEETKSIAPISEVVPTQKATLSAKQEPVRPARPVQPARQVVTRTVYVQPPNPPVIRIEAPVVKLPVQEASPIQEMPPPPAVAQVTEAAPSTTEPDEIVAFNQRTGIYHRLNCTWAKRCRNCITIHMSEAVKMGGRPAKTCDPL